MKKRYYLLLILLLYLFKGIIYRSLFSYKKVKNRANITLTDKKVIAQINSIANTEKNTLDKIITNCNKITSNSLSFTFDKVSSNPNDIINHKKANCIGYAALYCSVGNYMLKQQKLDHLYQFKHYVAHIYFLNQNIHTFLKDPFFKDHDIVTVLDYSTHKQTYIDPSLYDYSGIKTVNSL
ncbi:hypothetical protein [Tenacibaculum jejuense]|uniref:Transglutaminase-like domain-containing protein n=1 Tax=Tenacibaculum jejuense TaxID=584609 RepID=A0A238UDJ3_9FLAO|nr:hypothetical protein [Tenacibaculum jejuense]SNR17249.1 conserved protein of unknown function [Tenacibaculum jejuense]